MNERRVASPPIELVKQLQRRLHAIGVPSVVGGSGLLASLGLVDRVNDWDLVTDAEPRVVQQVLDDLQLRYSRAEPSGVFGTEALFKVSAPDHEIDVLVRFALHSPRGVVPIPAEAGSTWRGLTMARAEEWSIAYRLLGRHARADMLEGLTSPRGVGQR